MLQTELYLMAREDVTVMCCLCAYAAIFQFCSVHYQISKRGQSRFFWRGSQGRVEMRSNRPFLKVWTQKSQLENMLFVVYSQYDPLDLNLYMTKTVLDKNNQKQEKKNNKID